NLAVSPRIPEYILHSGIPMLGLCYGMQTMAEQLGGKVEGSSRSEYGHASVLIHDGDPLLYDLDYAVEEEGRAMQHVWMSHGDKVTRVPEGFEISASTASAPIAAMTDPVRRLYGLQFHPEVTHTKAGQQILNRF